MNWTGQCPCPRNSYFYATDLFEFLDGDLLSPCADSKLLNVLFFVWFHEIPMTFLSWKGPVRILPNSVPNLPKLPLLQITTKMGAPDPPAETGAGDGRVHILLGGDGHNFGSNEMPFEHPMSAKM